MHPYQTIFQNLNIQGNVRVHAGRSKTIEYDALHDELSLRSDDDTQAIITMIHDGKKMTLRTKNADPEAIKTLIEEHLPLLQKSASDIDNEPLMITDSVGRDFREFRYEDVSSEFLFSQWKKAKSLSTPSGMRIEKFIYGMEESEYSFFNHLGSTKTQKRASSTYSLEYHYEIGDFSDSEGGYRASATLEPVSPDFLQKIQDRLIHKSAPATTTLSGKSTIIALESDVMTSILEFVASALTAENIRQNQSFISHAEIGKKIFDERFTLSNHPEYPHSAFNSLFDGEWITSEPLVLIEKWVIKNLFVDSKNSKKFSLPVTGNGSVTNLVFESEWVTENPLANAEFLFTNLMAFHTVDKITGKFALEWEWFEIKDGKKGNFVKGVALSSSIKQLFENIESVWTDICVDANIFVPTMSFKNQKIVI